LFKVKFPSFIVFTPEAELVSIFPNPKIIL